MRKEKLYALYLEREEVLSSLGKNSVREGNSAFHYDSRGGNSCTGKLKNFQSASGKRRS